MKKTVLAFSLAIASIAFGQETPAQEMLTMSIPRFVTTNLNDKLHTEVTIDNSAGIIDIRRLNLDSIHADKHKSRHATVRTANVSTPAIRKVIKVRPCSTVKIDNNVWTNLHPIDISIVDVSGMSPTLVVDNSKFKVDITPDVYHELTEMKFIYEFEKSYSESTKTETKLDDIRKLSHDMRLIWAKTLLANKTCDIQFIKNKKIRKIIGEAWLYNNRYNAYVKANMLKNLAFLKDHGYDTVLVRFDCTEDKEILASMVDDIKNAGFDVFGTYIGQEGLHPAWNPYIAPETIEEYFSLLAPKFTGFLLNWRTTSNHAKILPIEFFNYICNTLRKSNSNILIYGEAYYGEIGPLHTVALMYTAPENVTGIVINNMGYSNYNIKSIVNRLFVSAIPNYRKMDKLGQVIGYGPYYCSRPDFNAHLTLEQEYQYKHDVESAFRRTGCGTMTLSHDGVDDCSTSLTIDQFANRQHYDTTDNILYDIKMQIAQ